ncbi:MAG: deoxyribose-phosphate aldolase [Candidatus Cloacimonetes bacterium]|nr:deoxyribose-phosphate aldolase [Candidatus Cloacimonadota bacterium]
MNKIADIAKDLFGDNTPCKCGGSHQICLKCHRCRANDDDNLYHQDKGMASIIDATILRADATNSDVEALIAVANQYETASVCINSHFIPLIKLLLKPQIKSCTVINFPLGASSVDCIAAEAEAALNAGVDEVDMVQNLSALLSGDYSNALRSIQGVVNLCAGRGILKVILETCYLSGEQIIISCLLAKKAGADFVKTSTGFGSAGATPENIALMRQVVGSKMGVKASGGIRNRAMAVQMIEAGASRIGASSVSAIVEQ